MRPGRVLVVFVLGVVLLVGWGAVNTGETEAAWTDRELARTTMTARVDKPIISSCTYDPGVLGILLASITVVWSFPTTQFFGGYAYAPPANVQFTLSNNTVSTTPVVSPNPTSTVVTNGYSTRLSLGILSGTLGGSYGINVRTLGPPGWVSEPVTALMTVNLLTSGSSCTIN